MALTLKFSDDDAGVFPCTTVEVSTPLLSGTGRLDCYSCGGSPPYTFTLSNKLATLTKLSEFVYRISRPSNPGSGEAGTAYVQYARGFGCGSASGAVCFGTTPSCSGSPNCCRCSSLNNVNRGCNAQEVAGGTSSSCTDCADCQTGACGTPPLVQACSGEGCDAQGCAGAFGAQITENDTISVLQWLANASTRGLICDARTQGMKDAGCGPCILVMNNVVVTVTDADGVSVSRTLTLG